MVNNKNPQVLKRSSDFEILKSSGRKTHPTRWMVLSYRKNQLGILRYGFTISKKVGSAVVRNRLKRWGREEFKKLIKSGCTLEVDLNVILRPIEVKFFQELTREEFNFAIHKAVANIK